MMHLKNIIYVNIQRYKCQEHMIILIAWSAEYVTWNHILDQHATLSNFILIIHPLYDILCYNFIEITTTMLYI